MTILLVFALPLILFYLSMTMLKLTRNDKKFIAWVNK
jgi:NhaP-type Na+/H+ and K+/H+ antiporter